MSDMSDKIGKFTLEFSENMVKPMIEISFLTLLVVILVSMFAGAFLLLFGLSQALGKH